MKILIKKKDKMNKLAPGTGQVSNTALGNLNHVLLYVFIASAFFMFVIISLIFKAKISEHKRNLNINKLSVGTYNGHDWIDLGLSVKWATSNIGASKPEDYGEYYAWGEKNTKNNYTIDNYALFVESIDDLWDARVLNYDINHTILDMDDDVAHIKWGGGWRMPTREEFHELINNCFWLWTNQNGVNGYKVSSKKVGFEENSIFLPAAGYYDAIFSDSLYAKDTYGVYWSSSFQADVTPSVHSFLFHFGPKGRGIYHETCASGLSVRPVCP